MKKFWIIWGAVIIFCLFFGTVFFVAKTENDKSNSLQSQVNALSQQISETNQTLDKVQTSLFDVSTTNWQTYTDTTYKFSIEYPAGYTYSEDKTKEGSDGTLLNLVFTNATNTFNVQVATKDAELSPSDRDSSISTDTIIGDLDAMQYDETAYGVVTDANVYRFFVKEDADQSLQNTLKMMVQSVKFTQ